MFNYDITLIYKLHFFFLIVGAKVIIGVVVGAKVIIGVVVIGLKDVVVTIFGVVIGLKDHNRIFFKHFYNISK